MISLSHAQWRKSARSGSGENCVEVANLPGIVAVRDSKNPDGGAIIVPRGAWRALADRIRSGRHDL